MNPPPPEPDTPSNQAPSNHALAAHGAFLRRLAKSLVRDEQRAEDIVQEAYVAVLKRPPPPRVGLRAWMSGIVKNLAHRSVRTDTRRREREEHAPSATPPDAPDDITVRLELQQRLAEAVRVLTEPMRTTVVRRYYDGLTPTQIAAAEGVSVRTIESRLRRAREQLRGVLDRAAGGSRGPWMLAFAPMAFDPQVLAGLFASAEAATLTVASGAAAGAPAFAASAALAVALVGGAGVGGFLLGRAQAPTPSATVPSRASDAGPTPPGEADAHLRTLESELVVLRNRRQRLEATLARLRGEQTPAPRIEHDTAEDEARWPSYKRDVEAVRFTAPVPDARLADVDWAEGGRALARLNASMAALATAKTQTEELNALGELQRWNGALVALETSLHEGTLDLESLAANVAFTRPYVQANLIRAALLYAKMPLSAAQGEALERIARRHVELDRLRTRNADEDTIALRRLVVLTEQRQAFFDEVGDLLAPAQREVLHPAAIRGRVGFDLFSDGSMWQRRMEPIGHHEPMHLEEHAVRLLVLMLEIQDPEQRAVVVDEVRRWMAAYPADHVKTGRDSMDRQQLYRLPRVRAAARASATMYERLIERLPRDTPAHAMLTQTTKSLLPFRRPR